MERAVDLIPVDTATRKRAEKVFSQIGLPISAAVNLFLNQVSLTGKIPFEVDLAKVPPSLNADLMTKEEFFSELREGLRDAEAGDCQEISEFRKEFLEGRGF